MTITNFIKTQLFCLCFLSITFVSAQDENYANWEVNYDEGLKALDSEEFEMAKLAFIKANTISEMFSESFAMENANTTFNLGKAYAGLDLRQQAIPLLEEALEMYRITLGDTHVDFTEKVKYIASIYEMEGSYDKAIEHFEIVLSNLKSNNLEHSLEYALILDRIAMAMRQKGDFKKAETILKECLTLTQSVVWKYHLTYGKILSDLSATYKSLGMYKEAIYNAQESISIFEKTSKDDPSYANAVTNLCQIYIKTGDYNKAIILQKKVIDNFSDADKTSISYAVSIYTLSTLYNKIDEFKKEISLLKEVEIILGVGHYAQAAVNNNLGLAYDRIGDYEMALFHAQKALNLTQPSNLSYAIRLQNIAFLYNKLGEKQKALDFYTSAQDAMKETYGIKHDEYGQLLNNIGKLQYSLGNYEAAEKLFKEALDNFLNNFNEKHPRYGYQLNDYARTLLKLGREEEAIALMQKNISIAEEHSRLDTESYFNLQFNLAKAYNSLERYDEALPLLTSATNNIRLKHSEEHPDYGRMLKSLGHTYIGLNNYDKALPVMIGSNDMLIKELDQIFKFRSETEKKAFLKIVTQHFDDMQSIPFTSSNLGESWNELNLNNQLMLKGLLLNNSKNILGQLNTLDNSEIEAKIDRFKTHKQQIAKVLSQPFMDRELDADSLKSLINSEEAELVKLYSSNFGEDLNLTKDWKLSRSGLKKDEVAIEFSNFRFKNGSQLTDSIFYVAYIYKKSWEIPKMVHLFEQSELESILENTNPNKLYTSQDLYDLIWDPIQEFTKNSTTVYFSPSGLLNQIQFAAISKPNEFSVGQNYNLVQLSSTAILANQPTEPKSESTLIVGDINYEYAETTSIAFANTDYAYLDTETLKNTRATRSRGETWTYLEGGLQEINDLQSIFNTYNKDYLVLSKNEATETSIKKLSGNSPNIIHIATHGFFYENLETGYVNQFNLSTEDQYRLAEDPLLRSGLILAGANYAWKNGSNPNEEDDGILSALEISNMDLSNTDIVVLSACETGLGDIEGSEGVYGLQRAFKMAGVYIIVMSLWKVPDAETAEFMNLFYQNWMKDNQVRKAFTFAQRAMQEKYKEEPLKWAAFVLVE
jgi:CHAT domain-containing protein/Tfp pilus assembly protein PilF